ncbi:helix-turn-helix domain-containing protein [Streptococcus dysgalactiae]|uniref:helix-turn-helix domain-containing protein n=1 Tax=Streptococcus dysgalactiae TaxID=1334 RepID=UPI003A7A8588
MPQPTITIAEIRAKNNKMSQEEFGKSLGVSAQTINSWEKDITKIKSRHLIKIYQLYGVRSSELLGS